MQGKKAKEAQAKQESAEASAQAAEAMGKKMGGQSKLV